MTALIALLFCLPVAVGFFILGLTVGFRIQECRVEARDGVLNILYDLNRERPIPPPEDYDGYKPATDTKL